jgi:hypothetical protein
MFGNFETFPSAAYLYQWVWPKLPCGGDGGTGKVAKSWIREGVMASKISGATGLRTSVLATALALAVTAGGLGATDASAAPKKRDVATATPAPVDGRGVNYSYQAGPRTRVFITRRSWLDGGTEVLPGDRKFTDYAYAPGYHYGRTIDNLNQGRNPLSENFDIGGGPTQFPLY